MSRRRAIPASVRRMVLARDGWCCRICGRALGCKIEVDHIRPVAIGGTNDPDNLQSLHPACHLRFKTSEDRPRWVKADAQAKACLPRAERKPGSIKSRENPWPPRGSRKLRSRGFEKRPGLREQAGAAVSTASL